LNTIGFHSLGTCDQREMITHTDSNWNLSFPFTPLSGLASAP
jgi:hypothetical protein